MSPFREHYGALEPETLALLEISFNETWTELQRNGGSFDPVSMRSFADRRSAYRVRAEGETDPRRLKALSLAAVKQRIPRKSLQPLSPLVPLIASRSLSISSMTSLSSPGWPQRLQSMQRPAPHHSDRFSSAGDCSRGRPYRSF